MAKQSASLSPIVKFSNAVYILNCSSNWYPLASLHTHDSQPATVIPRRTSIQQRGHTTIGSSVPCDAFDGGAGALNGKECTRVQNWRCGQRLQRYMHRPLNHGQISAMMTAVVRACHRNFSRGNGGSHDGQNWALTATVVRVWWERGTGRGVVWLGRARGRAAEPGALASCIRPKQRSRECKARRRSRGRASCASDFLVHGSAGLLRQRGFAGLLYLIFLLYKNMLSSSIKNQLTYGPGKKHIF
jgi:hypothetical protein